MSWVKLDDGAMDHPKILKLSAYQFRLWVRGLCYCQKHLTDGLIPAEAIKTLLGTPQDVKALVDAGLWHGDFAGVFQVHDYLEWNDSKALVVSRREAAAEERQVTRDRLKRWREAKKAHKSTIQTIGNAACNGVTSPLQSPLHHPLHETLPKRFGNADVTVLTTPHHTLVQKDPSAAALSVPIPPRPKEYGRVVLFQWQQEALLATLGPHAKGFELDAWVFGLSAMADRDGLVLEKKTVWPWVQAKLSEEVRRRGLPIAGSEPSEDETLARMREEIARQNAAVRRA